jgi:hypothetical protein
VQDRDPRPNQIQTNKPQVASNPTISPTWIEFDGRTAGWDQWPASITIYRGQNLVEVELRPRPGPTPQQPPMERVMLPKDVLRQLIAKSEAGD